jgi:xylose isomerase
MTSISAVGGLSASMAAFDRDAYTVSRTSLDPSATSSDDFIGAIAAMPSDAIGVRAAIQVIKSQDEMVGSILDLLA